MSSLVHARRPLLLRTLSAAIVAVVASTLLTTVLADSASAHGNIMFPASRNQQCLNDWGTNHLAPQMATEDPMCYQAWQADPGAMWNWNGQLRDGVGGIAESNTPNGTLCSNGRAQAPRYNALDTVGNWRATNVGNTFTARIFDQASHGADFFRFYVTRQGFNPLTQAPRWQDLELVRTVGNTPASQWQQVTGGVQLEVQISAPGRTGRHIMWTVWQASHLDQVYAWCSDVNFGGVSNPPTQNPPTQNPPTQNPPTQNPPSQGCTATYSIASTWGSNFQADVRVTAGSSGTNGWRVTLNYGSAVSISQSWNATMTQGASVTATNVSHNGRLGANGTASFGFIGSGASGAPTVSCTAT